jgi:hypothetical protein
MKPQFWWSRGEFSDEKTNVSLRILWRRPRGAAENGEMLLIM